MKHGKKNLKVTLLALKKVKTRNIGAEPNPRPTGAASPTGKNLGGCNACKNLRN